MTTESAIELAKILTPKESEINYFEGITGLVPAKNIKAGTRLKIAIMGEPKTGKSWFAATAPKPVLVYDFDNRAESLAGMEGVMIKTLEDINQKSPIAFKALESDLSTLIYRKKEGKPIPATFVFDSITYLIRFIQNEAFTQGLDYRSLKLSDSSSIRMSKNWDAVNAVERALHYLIGEYSQLGNLIFVFHEKPEKDKTKSTDQKSVYTEKITIDPQFLAPILSRFNEVYRIEIDSSNKHMVTCKPSREFTASTTLKLDEKELPNIQGMLNKHNSRSITKA